MEGTPSGDQKQRLADWLAELKFICRSYQILLDTDDTEMHVVDLVNGNTIGVGLTYLLDTSGRITGYDCTGSILDGVWLVDGPDGPVEQRSLGSVWARRPIEDMPS